MATGKRPTEKTVRDFRKAVRAVPAAVPLSDMLDRRTVLGQRVQALEESFHTALGGDLSPQRQLLVQQVIRVLILIDSYDGALFQGLDPRDEGARKFVADLNKQRWLLAQLLGQLGLDRMPKPVKSARDILTGDSSD